MADLEKIYSFVRKFLKLRLAGQNASLYLSTQDGKTSVNLGVEMGPAPLPEHHKAQNHHAARPSRVSRRKRRVEARRLAAEEAASFINYLADLKKIK